MSFHPILTQGGGIRIDGEANLIDCNIHHHKAAYASLSQSNHM